MRYFYEYHTVYVFFSKGMMQNVSLFVIICIRTLGEMG